MAQRRFHYEQAFEHYLRSNRVPYVAVDEAKKALMPASRPRARGTTAAEAGGSLKSFDFVVYTPGRNLLVDVKGRMFGVAGTGNPLSSRRYESWVTQDDVDSLTQWQKLFGPDFQAVFVFAYCLRQQPPDALFEEVFEFGQHWYALREVSLADYVARMTQRSRNWSTVHVSAADFAVISRSFCLREGASKPDGDSCPARGTAVCSAP
jgi:hypothetical protein